MMKNFRFQMAVLLLATSGVTFSMMQTTKKLHNESLLKLNKSAYSNNIYNFEVAKTEAKRKVLAANLPHDYQLFMFGQVNSNMNDRRDRNNTYDFEITKIKAKCNILAAPELNRDDRYWLLGQVEYMKE